MVTNEEREALLAMTKEERKAWLPMRNEERLEAWLAMTNEEREAWLVMIDEEREAWLAIRKEAGLKIDPETAEVGWVYTFPCDPYNIFPDCSEARNELHLEYFACSPGSDIWVAVYDLPKATQDAIWKKHSPAGTSNTTTAPHL